MISKKELLETIDEALNKEEQVITLYCNHCIVSFEFMESDTAKVTECRERFTKLRDDSRRHRNILEDLRAKIAEDERDAF